MDGHFEVQEWCLHHSDVLLSFLEGRLFKIIKESKGQPRVWTPDTSVSFVLNTNKPNKISKLITTKNLIWNNFEKRLFEKSTILSTEFLMRVFLFQMLSKSWLIVWLMAKLNKSPILKQTFTMNCSNSWKKWRMVFPYWKLSILFRRLNAAY